MKKRKQTKEHTAKINTPERAEKIRKTMKALYATGKKVSWTKGKNLSKSHREKIKKNAIRGELHKNFKGEEAGYGAKHDWIKRYFGKAKKCQEKKCNRISKNYQWAKKKHREYTRNVNDYLQLCRSCHAKYDYVPKNRKCSLKNCGKPHKTNGFCSMHAERKRKWGSPFKVKLNYRKIIVID